MFIKVYMHIKISIVQCELVGIWLQRDTSSRRARFISRMHLKFMAGNTITVLRKETDLKEQWGKWGTSISSDFNDMAAL